MGTVKDLADIAFRDRESPGSAEKHEPIKSEIRGVFDEIDAQLEDFSDIVLGGRIAAETWSYLSGLTAGANTAATVEPSDTGTHTDPVVGGTVDNAGTYRYSTSPAGWKRIGPYRALEVASQSEVDAGTNNAKAVTPQTLQNKKVSTHETIWLQYISGPYTAMVVRPVRQNTRLTGTGYDYRFRLQMPFDSGIGSTALLIQQPDGTLFLESSLRREDGVSQLGQSYLKQYNVVDFLRNPDPIGNNPGNTNVLRLLSFNDKITEPLMRTLSAMDDFGKLTSVMRPLAAYKAGDNEWLIDVMPHADHYVGATAEGEAARSDFVRFSCMDLGDLMSDPGGVPSLNSIFARFSFVQQQFASQRFTALDSGTNVETGQVPSIFEPALILGNMALTANSLNFQLAAPGHGHLGNTAWEMSLDLDGVVTDGIEQLPIGSEIHGDVIVTTCTAQMEVPAGQTTGDVEYVETYAREEEYQVRFDTTMDFTVSGMEVEPGTRDGGYGAMMPMSDCNMIVGYINGVKQTPLEIYKRDGSSVVLGNVEKVVAWHTKNPRIQLVWENEAGAGYTHWEDEGSGPVPVPIAQAGFIINNDWGTKFYCPIYPNPSKESLAGKVLTFASTYKIINADPL